MGLYSYDYPRPALTVDAIVLRTSTTTPEVLLIRRAHPPFQDCWAFPGGFVDEGESAEEAVVRELLEETGLKNVALQQCYTASRPGRDPRGWTVSVFFFGELKTDQLAVAADDAAEVNWFALDALPELAFDHEEILNKLTEMRGKFLA